MKKIGYIHRYDKTEEKGILVYGYNKGPFWNSPAPILFSKSQCKTSVKTGILVYFEIDQDETIRNIEYASIFNFDRNLLLSYVSVYDTRDWNECERHTHICYQNIFELKELIPFEETNSDDVSCDENTELDNGDDWYLSGFFDDDILNLGNGEKTTEKYRKIRIPKLIDEEYALFGRQFPSAKSALDDFWDNNESEKKQSIIIDILNPLFWMPSIPKSRKKYYGKNANEVKDLFDILVWKKRKSYDRYLSSIRSSRRDLWNLNKEMQRMLYPNLFQNDCVSPNWAKLLNRLSYFEVKNIYIYYPLLQPVLSESFCEENLDILSEHYGFPSVAIAEKYLINAIRKIGSASEYCHYKSLLCTVKKCGVKHLPEEGVPLCAIDKKRLDNITISLGKKRNKIIDYIQIQISKANPNLPLDLQHVVPNCDINLMLQIGEFYDFIGELLELKTCFIYFEAENLIKKYKKIPDSAHILFDSYLSLFLNDYLVNSLKSRELSPFQLHWMLNKLSKWIDDSFLSRNSDLVESVFSKTDDASDLKSAFEYKYIQENDFIRRYYELSAKRPDEECLNDLYDCHQYCLPEETQLYILRRILSHYDLHFTYSYGDKNYDFPGYVKVRSLNDFLKWMNDNTFNKGCECGRSILKNVSKQIQKDILSSLAEEQSWYLFENNILSILSTESIRNRLLEAYSEFRLVEKCFEKDCFQEQMSVDVINETNNQLIKLIIDKLNPKYRALVEEKIDGFGKLYLWSLNLTEKIDWNCMKLYFAELPDNSQKKVFRYLFLVQSNYKLYDMEIFLNTLFEVLIQSKFELEKRTENIRPNSAWIKAFDSGLSVPAFTLLVQILQAKLKAPKSSVKYSQIESTIAMFSSHKGTVLRTLKGFFDECTGWLLLSSYNTHSTEYYSRNGFITKINEDNANECAYKICFYETPLDINDEEIDYLDYSDIEEVEETLQKNFDYKYEDGGYIIPSKDEISLKEFITRYSIDDRCNLMNDIFGHNEHQGYGIPKHLNFPTKYKENNLFVCNCSQHKDVDPNYGIPYCWCKKLPCTRKTFLQPNRNWEKFKFVDLLWIVLRGKMELEQLWHINSEVSSFMNELAQNDKESLVYIKSKPLQKDEEVGEWTKEMSIFSCESCDDYSDSENEECDYEEPYCERDTYNNYNGSWAQDVEGYSDDDIDTIFDGDPSAYWNID